MKHPNPASETWEFNLGKAPQLRCVNQKTTTCGTCESCELLKTLRPVKAWFSRAGDQSRKRFALGLVRRFHSVDLLQYFVNLLNPLLCKDFTYARTRTTPSLHTDRCTMSADRALSAVDLEREITQTWYWFQSANYWTKSNFFLSFMRECEAHLLNLIGIQARTLLTSEKKAFVPGSHEDYETDSIASTRYSHSTRDHPELDLLVATRPEYSTIQESPLYSSDSDSPSENQRLGSGSNLRCGKDSVSVADRSEVVSDESGDEGFGDEDSQLSSVDPTCMVISTSVKAHSGVSKHKDFIRWLPVHLSKYILGMLDQVSLFNCVCVSRTWRTLVEEVHREYFVQQHLWEDVMLMQGSAAQGCNPVYAKDIDVAVPNLEPNSFHVIRTEGDVIETTFKSEVNLTTAYGGYSTRNIIMEERNVYCGAYNVMVLIDGADSSRVMHTDGGTLIALGSQDRKVRFINNQTGKETGPVISGHAGSVRCVALNERKGYVLSGSYDTSIRCWSLETGKCLKIFRGHRDTIMCLEIFGDKFASGSKDHMCKVWTAATGQCVRTFKHRQAVLAVALSDHLCISGCEGSKVKVWDMTTGHLIKKLTGHHGPVTGIRFDRWHIVTGSKDGYALAWSSQGDHRRCLAALRHPKEVLCLEFMYLRIVTGCADGKLRIWNMITGDCLRIMRGNSRSDPITSLIAINNRVTLNTANNLLVLNFEAIDYDYTLGDDKMPPLVQYSKYSDAPIRQHPYSYVRAQRMAKAGASNTKIIYHGGRHPETTYYGTVKNPEQVPHSAKTLSRKSLDRARRIQSGVTRSDSAYESQDAGDHSRRRQPIPDDDRTSRAKSATVGGGQSVRSVSLKAGRPPAGPSRPTTAKSRATSVRSGTQTMYSVGGFQLGRGDEDSEIVEEDEVELRRRVSWAFEQPAIPKTKELGLSETKALLRSQIRARGDVVPPDFIYLSVNAIQASMKATEATKNMGGNRRDEHLHQRRRVGRPSSSPSRIDPRCRVPVEEMGYDQLLIEQGQTAPGRGDMQSLAESKISRLTQSTKSKRVAETGPLVQTKAAYVRDFNVTHLSPTNKNFTSIHSRNIQSSIPKGKVLRPHTASDVPTSGMMAADDLQHENPFQPRSKSAGFTAQAGVTANSVMSSAVPIPSPRKKYHHFSTSATEISMVPMLMYPKDLNENMENMKTQRQERVGQGQQFKEEPPVGAVSDYNNPLRTHVEFRLQTNDNVQQQVDSLARNQEEQQRKLMLDLDKKRRIAWLSKVRNQMQREKQTERAKPVKKVAS